MSEQRLLKELTDMQIDKRGRQHAYLKRMIEPQQHQMSEA